MRTQWDAINDFMMGKLFCLLFTFLNKRSTPCSFCGLFRKPLRPNVLLQWALLLYLLFFACCFFVFQSIYFSVSTEYILFYQVYIYASIHLRIFPLQEESEKEALQHFKHVIKICPNREHIFQNKLRNMWTAILKILTKFLLNKLTFSM